MNIQYELNKISRYLQSEVDVALDMPYIQQQKLSIPIEERKLLLEEMIEKQKRLIQLMVLGGYILTEIGIEKGALRVLENFTEELNKN